jgi:hypothetical protein
MKELQRRVAALEQLMAPGIDYIELMGYAARQMEAEMLRLPFPEPPEGLAERCPKGYEGSVFLWGRNAEEWNATMARRAVELEKMMGMIANDSILDPKKS